METKITTPWLKGLIISGVLIVYGLVMYIAGMGLDKSQSWIQYCLLVIGIIIADTTFAKQKQGNVTFGNVFAHGFKVTAAVIVVMVIFSIVFVKLIAPELVDKVLEQSRAEMEKKGDLSASDIEAGLGMVRKFFLPFMIGGIVLMFAIIGAVGSLIGAGVAKKNPNYNPLEQ